MVAKTTLLKLGSKRQSSEAEHAKGQPSRRQRGATAHHGTQHVPGGMMPASGDDLSVSSRQAPDHQAMHDQAAEDSWGSPDVPAALLTGTSSGFADYQSRLRMHDRCTVVAFNDRGAQCVAVATAEEQSAGLLIHVSVPHATAGFWRY